MASPKENLEGRSSSGGEGVLIGGGRGVPSGKLTKGVADGKSILTIDRKVRSKAPSRTAKLKKVGTAPKSVTGGKYGGGSSSSGVHFDHYQRCYASLEKEKVFEGCLKKAEDKWNLTKQSDETAAKNFSTSVEIVQRSCCAMYEALNCAQNRSCQFCADEILPPTDDASSCQSPSSCALTSPYTNLSTLCPQAEPQVPLDIPTVCPGRRKSSETGLIIAVVLFVLGILACIGVLLAVFLLTK
ncbi:hypothetical protein TYRP_015381 [Tyrophagus putrescentiae]|nr:hypothetical protein TYRP_015381 [Tyrophagus putrescentiae]